MGTQLAGLNDKSELASQAVSDLKPLPTPKTVYNLTVDQSHTYFVSGLLVHNAKEDEEEEPTNIKEGDD
ncbi:MAG: hypothetical protein IPK82_34345 [Polyangiaceae bacterium]|nr:hypothetical protein [Polyangiaceae bacterium]